VSSVLLLDISRLIWRAHRKGPTGIDRVELAYAQHFIAGQSERPAYAVLHLLGFVFAVSPARGRRFVAELSARWAGSASPNRWGDLKTLARIYWQLLAGRWLFGPALRRALRARRGTPIFMVVSHHHVARPYTVERIQKTLGVRTVCLIHDLIPIDYPEYFKRGWESRYQRLVSTVGQCFDAVIANSDSTARSLRACLQREPGASSLRPAIRTAPLGVRAFPDAGTDAGATEQRPYFVVLGTIEPRKNHLLLLNLWARLASAMPFAPRLLVIGARGWENEQVVDMLERSRRLRGLVKECNGLSDTEVGALLHGARALLLPSLAEGFGLPLAEALASGVPAICSDIPVFREVGREAPEYLDPLDVRAWMDAVLDYCDMHSPRRLEQMQRLEQWRAPDWVTHFTVVEQLLRDLGATPQPVLVTSTNPSSVATNG
jgi:glycosyltransferase involved in cell wall biosynthesis